MKETKITIGQVVDLFSVLDRIKLNAVPERAVRDAVLTNYVNLKRVNDKVGNAIENARKKLIEGKDKDIAELQRLRDEEQASTDEARKMDIRKTIERDHADLLAIESELSAFARKKRQEEVKDVEIIKIDRDALMDALAASGMAFGAVDILNPPLCHLIKA